MKSKLLLISVLSLAISNASQASYYVNIPLEEQKIVFEYPSVTGDIQLTPVEINRGDSSSIIWNYTYADEINIENVGVYHTLKGSQSVNPLESTTYNILIKSGDKSKTETLYLNVIQPTQNIEFNADSYRIGYGSSTNLNWNVDNAESVNIDNGVGFQSLNGLYKVNPIKDTTYTLTAKGFTGISDKIQTVDIIVVPDAVINTFLVDNDKLTVGDTATFSWNVLNAESLTLNNETINKTTGTKPVVFSTAGNFPYKLQTTSLSGLTAYSETKTINVYNSPIITSFTVNGSPVVDVSPSADLNFAWTSTFANVLKLNNTTVSGNTTKLTASDKTGSVLYTLEAINEANKSITKQVTVNVIGDPVLNAITGPSSVFTNMPFALTWTGTGASKYSIRANNAVSGISTSENDLGTVTNKSVTPTNAGTFTYTVAAYNTANAKKEQTKNVIVESDPSMTTLLVNGATSISVSPNTVLTFTTSGMSSGATLAGRDINNSTNVTLPNNASTTPGTTTYYGSPTKTLNGITKFGTARNVNVTVIAAPTIGGITAPTSVFSNAPFTATWSGTDISSYSIKSNNASSGIPTSDTGLSTNTSTSITPTAAGNYTYTLTATNSVGVITNKSFTVNVEANPTFDSFTVNNSNSVVVGFGAALTYAGTGISSGAFYQGRTSGNDGNITNPATAPSTAGTYTYYMSAAKTLNTVNRYSALRSVSVRVVNAPTIGSLSANPTIIDAGQSATLTFSTANSSYNEINGVNMGSSPTYVVSPTATTTYTLTAKNDAGQTVTQSVTVTVQNWTATSSVYGSWTNVSGRVQYNCGAWSPSGSAATANTTFTQNASCLTDQTRTRQDRIISSATGEVKNTGAVATESQTISQTANRSYSVTYSAWGNTSVSACSSWTPGTQYYRKGTVFTQTGTGCSGTQTRTRTESYIDHLSGSTVIVSTKTESQSVAGVDGGTRSAVGTYCVRCDN